MRYLLPLLVICAIPTTATAQIGESTSRGGADAETEGASTPAAENDSVDAADSETPSTVPTGSRATARSFAGDDRVLTHSPSLAYGTGGFRTSQATGMPTGNFGLSLFGEYYGGQSVVRNGDSARRFVGTLGLSWTPIQYFEAWFSLGARSTTNSLGRPELIQSVGDISLGLKGMYEFLPGIHGAVVLRLNAPAGADTVGLDFGALGVDVLAVGTFDLRDLADVPVRVHVNAGYVVDGSSNLFDRDLDRVERFGQHVFDYNRAHIGLGVDAPVPYVTPSLEWTMQVPSGAACDSFNPQPCVSEGGFSAVPNYLTIGAKSAPMGPGLIVNTAFDLGLTTAESQGTPAIPAWNWIFGLAYDLNTAPAPAPVVVPEPVVAAVSHVRGALTDSATGVPIEGARVSYVGTEFTDQVTGADGRFRSFDFAPGTVVNIEITHPNYNPRTLEVTVSDTVREGNITLEQAFVGTRLQGEIDLAGDPAAVSIVLTGDDSYEISLEEGESTFQQDVTPGEYRLFVVADGHVSVLETRTFEAGLLPLPIEMAAISAGTNLRLTLSGVEFVEGSPGIGFDEENALTAEGQAALDELAAFMDTDPSMRVRVRAHIDDREDGQLESEITEARAQAVVDYLVSKGVSANRLRSEGVGALEPLFPNVSERNRELNNRVELQVVR
jgi:outer membrane protein OmpA-like peptidoglycan-associated protein